nr:FAD-dependent thymidylate synthase [uncultured bacterium]
MKVHLAGYNLDTEVLRELEEKAGKREDITPEVISAAYARISRDPRPIEEIRRDARREVEKTRRSNSTIIFKMGHHSVAEHAVFNLDIVGVSRLAMEEVEKFRLCSYTEKSQRYITLKDEYVVPEEIKNTGLVKLFKQTVELQNEAYERYFDRLKEYVFKKHESLARDEKNHSLLEGWAKEDARYITSLATSSQVGQTINARNLELLLRRFASNPLAEVREIGKAIYNEISGVAPSIVLFHSANDRDLKTYPEIREISRHLSKSRKAPALSLAPVTLVEYTRDGDECIAAALLHSTSDLPYAECRKIIKKLPQRELKRLFKASWKNLQFYDSMLREFEYAGFTFNIVLSAACFGQLKRHRMSTITVQGYDPGLSVTIPQSITACSLEEDFLQVIRQTEQTYQKLLKEMPLAAPYVLTNSHRRRALVGLNVRELYHISRLRQDAHAQWDIRNVSRAMTEEAKKVMPMALELAGGKDEYSELYARVFGAPPAVTQAVLPQARKIR